MRVFELSVYAKSFPFVVGAATMVGFLHRDQQDWIRAPPGAGRTFSPGAGRAFSTSTWTFTLSYSGPQLVVRTVMLAALERRMALGMHAACAWLGTPGVCTILLTFCVRTSCHHLMCDFHVSFWNTHFLRKKRGKA